MKPPLPKEHGAWPVLLLPIAIGAALSGRPSLLHLSLAGAALFTFMLRLPVTRAFGNQSIEVRRGNAGWAVLFGMVGVACAVPLFLADAPYMTGLVILGALIGAGYMVFFPSRKMRSMGAELYGTLGLTIAGPAALRLGTQSGWEELAGFWILLVSYFGFRVLFVRTVIRKMRGHREEAVLAGRTALTFGGVGLLVSGTVGFAGWIPPLTTLALLFSLGRGAIALRWEKPPATARALGWRELTGSVLFALLIVILWRL